MKMIAWCLMAMTVTCVEPYSAGSAFVVNPSGEHRALALPDPSPRTCVLLRGARPGGVFLRMADFSLGDKVIAKGKVGTLVKFEKSWWTVELDGVGGVVKSRPGGLAPATPAKAAAAKAASPTVKLAVPKKRTGTAATKRISPKVKAGVKPAVQPTVKSPPRKASLSPALKRVLEANSSDLSTSDSFESYAACPAALADLFDASEAGELGTSGAAIKAVKAAKYPDALDRGLDPRAGAGGDASAVAYPDALAEVLGAAEGKTTPKGGKKKGSVAYPTALARVIAMSEQDSPTDGATASGKVAKYPSQLSRVLQAMDAGVQSATPETPTTKKAVAGKPARKSRATKSRVQYPAALKRYLDMAASASAMTAAQAPQKPAQATQKPKRASYPEVLANVLTLTEGNIARPSPKTAPAKSTAKTAANNKTRVNPPSAATYPPVLAQLLEAAKNTENLDQVQEELQEAGAFLAKYPDALATYLDLVEMSTVPPSVPPPKRAS